LPSTLTHHHTVKQSRKSYSGKYFAYQSKRKSIPNPSFTKGRELYEYDESKTRVIKHNESTGKITTYINDLFDIEDGEEKIYFFSGDLKLATLDGSSEVGGGETTCTIPSSGNWTVTQDCTIATFETAPADVTITAGTILTIASSGILEVDLNNNSLTVENGGGILVENGGSLAQSGLLPPPSQGGGQGEISLVFHHSDHLSGASVDTDQAGNILQVTDYYPYGDSRIEDTTSDFHNDYTYTGKERDENTELLYYEARYYNSNIGRFISIDPWSGDITDPQSLNKYAYVRNNPLKYVDPSGATFVAPNFITLIDNLMTTVKNSLNTAKENTNNSVHRFGLNSTGVNYLNAKGHDISAQFLEHSLQDNPSNLHFGNNSQVSNKINWGIYFTPPKYAFTIRAYGLSFKSNGIRRNVLGRG
jgi:RHS repeat-associated protein